jgi:anti-anti-sigma factor
MFSVELDVQECGDNVIVALHGELDLADAADVVTAITAAAAGRRKTILDLAGLVFIDCTGAAAIVRAQRLVARDGGQLLLAGVRPRILRVFVLSRRIEAVSVHVSVAQAAGVGCLAPLVPTATAGQGSPVAASARSRTGTAQATRDAVLA